MKQEESMWKIIKIACRKCFDAETSSEAGRANLCFGILLFSIIVLILLPNSIIDKILYCLNNNYQIGMPWYATFVLIICLILYSVYCINKIVAVNKVKKDIDDLDNKI